jgi:hypothetical protein
LAGPGAKIPRQAKAFFVQATQRTSAHGGKRTVSPDESLIGMCSDHRMPEAASS